MAILHLDAYRRFDSLAPMGANQIWPQPSDRCYSSCRCSVVRLVPLGQLAGCVIGLLLLAFQSLGAPSRRTNRSRRGTPRFEGHSYPIMVRNGTRRCCRLDAGSGLCGLSTSRITVARRAYNLADFGRGYDRWSSAGGRRRQPAGCPARTERRRLVLFNLPLSLADLGVRLYLDFHPRLRLG
jgi:hypothetical protein